MKPRTLSAIGGWQSFLFCIGMYAVALFFSIFICSSVFYAVNAKPTGKAGADKAVVVAPAKQQIASIAH